METTQQDPDQPHEPQQSQDLITEYHSDIRQIEIEGYELVVKKARNALFWAGGLIFLGEMIAMYKAYTELNWLVLGIALVEAGIFVGLGLYTKKKPYTAIILGLIAFLGFIALSTVVSAIDEGAEGAFKAIFGGILVKILILVALIRPISDARELQNIKNS